MKRLRWFILLLVVILVSPGSCCPASSSADSIALSTRRLTNRLPRPRLCIAS